MVFSFNINYKYTTSSLCKIGSKYDTDKSSLRRYVSDLNHCHPYTIFYDDFFKNQRFDKLTIAEIGVSNDSSILMWKDYFQFSKIICYKHNNNSKIFNNIKNIFTSNIDVKSQENIDNTFKYFNYYYDLIIEDSTNNFEDQIRIIKNVYKFLRPGGVLVIEDIYQNECENKYIESLSEILEFFQDYFFINFDHYRKNSFGLNNDKIFVLIKKGKKILVNPPVLMHLPISLSHRINSRQFCGSSFFFSTNYPHNNIGVVCVYIPRKKHSRRYCGMD
jgi:SAM-dependent methyltransferase